MQLLRKRFVINPGETLALQMPQVTVEGYISSCVVTPDVRIVDLRSGSLCILINDVEGEDPGIDSNTLARMTLRMPVSPAMHVLVFLRMPGGKPGAGVASVLVCPNPTTPAVPDLVLGLVPRRGF